jgi:hypothetical protein
VTVRLKLICLGRPYQTIVEWSSAKGDSFFYSTFFFLPVFHEFSWTFIIPFQNAEQLNQEKSQRKQHVLECIPIEGKFGQEKEWLPPQLNSYQDIKNVRSMDQ